MIICPNLKNPDVAREFNELVQATSEKAAYYIWSLNNGNAIDKAPNGASSKLFLTLLDYYGGDRVKAIQAKAKTYSKSFLNWFGDWIEDSKNSSKVVDENGEPLVVYHGTNAYFDTFELLREVGFHFGTKSAAESVGFNVRPFYLNIKNLDRYEDNMWFGKKFLHDFVKDGTLTQELADLWEREAVDYSYKKANTFDPRYYNGILGFSEYINEKIQNLKGREYGVEYVNSSEDRGSISYIVLNPNQIKSVDNQGTFSNANDDIYMMRSNEIYNGFNPYKLKQIGCIVLYGKVSQSFDSYLKKSRGVYPTKFYDSSKNLLYVKSNNRKNSIRYDVVDVNSGEIYVRGLPLYTKDQYDELLSKNRSINKEIDKNWKPYDNHSFAFRKFLNTPSKGLFKFAAKQYLKEATSLEKGAKVNYTELIDRFVDNFSDDFWKYIITNTLELSVFGTLEGLTGLLGVTTTIKPWLLANFIFPRGISKRTLIYKLEQKLGIKIRDEENFGIRFNEHTPYNELIKGIRQWYNYYHHDISEEESIALYAKQTDRTVEEVKKYLEVLKEQESMSSSLMRHNILTYSKFDSALMDITKEYNQKYIEYIKLHSDDTLDELSIGNIFIVFNRDSSPLFMKRLATVLHEPYHALNMLHRRHAAELHEAFKKFYDTNIGKDICLSVIGELVNAGYDANFEEEILANMFAYFMTPVELRGDYTEVPIMNILSEKLQELEKMPNFQEITQTEDDAEFEKKTKDYTNEQKTILLFFLKLQKAITAFIKKVYTAFSNLINGFIGKQNIQQDVQQNPLQENTDVINAKDALEDIFSLMYAIMHAPINEGEEILTEELDGIKKMVIGEKGASNLDNAEEATIRMDNLQVAKDMEISNKDAITIKIATGWERGADNKWRYEIEDIKLSSKLHNIINDNSWYEEYPKDLKIKDIVYSKDLLLINKIYPDFQNFDIVLTKDPNNGRAASIDYIRKRIHLCLAYDDHIIRKAFIHELLHYVQLEEGFASGGNKNQMMIRRITKESEERKKIIQKITERNKPINDEISKLFREYQNQIPNIIDSRMTYYIGEENDYHFLYETLRLYPETDELVELADKIKELQSKLERKPIKNTDYNITEEDENNYYKLAGEVESRATERRFGLSLEEKRNSLFTDEMYNDVAKSDLIFLLRNLEDDSMKQFSLNLRKLGTDLMEQCK